MGGEDLIESDDAARRHDHICFVFSEPTEFRDAARSFLAEGLATGNRVLVVVSQPAEAESWRDDEVLGPALSCGQADIMLAGPAYGETGVVDPPAQITVFLAALRQALDSGFKGLRVAADVTSLLGTPAGVDAFARYEYLVDSHIAAAPMSGMCGYRRRAISEADLAQMACLHPNGSPSAATSFRLYTGSDGACAVAGYLDFSGWELFSATLQRTELPAAGQDFTIDASRLEFVDHNNLLALEAAARARCATVLLRSRAPHIGQLAQLLELTAVRVVTG